MPKHEIILIFVFLSFYLRQKKKAKLQKSATMPFKKERFFSIDILICGISQTYEQKRQKMHMFFSVYRSRVSAWLAQLVRASIRWVEGNEFKSWVDDIFHLPVLCDAQNEISPKKHKTAI